MRDILLIKSLIEDLDAITHPYPVDQIDRLERRSKMIISNVFGGGSTYIEDIHRILHPRVGVSTFDPVSREVRRIERWERSRDRIRNVFTTMIEEIQLSTGLGGVKKQQDSDVLEETDTVAISPVFGRPLPRDEQSWSQIFVLMPFREDLKAVYSDHILKTAESLNLTCKRGDDIFSDKVIMDDIWSAIFYADVCIADCTGRNPNVFYEMGIAHTLGRRCILITQDMDDVPFDIRHWRVIIYEHTSQGMEKFEDDLTQTLQSVLKLDYE